MKKYVDYFVKKFIICTKNKVPNPKYSLRPPVTNTYVPWECVQIDLIGSWKITNFKGLEFSIKAVTIIDVGTRWHELPLFIKKGPITYRLSLTASGSVAILTQRWLSTTTVPSSLEIFTNSVYPTVQFLRELP